MTPGQLMNELQRIVQASQDEANRLLDAGRPSDAKRVLADAQRDLRDLKRACAEAQRGIREDATDARQRVAKKGQVVGLVAGGKARGAMARGRAMEQRRLAGKREEALRPYADVKASIDRVLSQMDQAKADLAAEDSGSSRPPASAPPSATPAPPPPPTPAAWARDPFGRHELRYWNGAQWTEHVSNRGATAIDPPQH